MAGPVMCVEALLILSLPTLNRRGLMASDEAKRRGYLTFNGILDFMRFFAGRIIGYSIEARLN